jgi:hypothetical protein
VFPVRRLAAGVCLTLALAACTNDGNTSSGAAGSSSSGAPGAVLADDRPLEPVGDPATRAVQGRGYPDRSAPVAHLSDVRVAGHDDFDRFVLEFDGDRVPGYRISYVQPPITEVASGRPVDVAGSAFLEVRTTPASVVDLSGESAEEVYEGPDRVAPAGGSVITEAVGTGGVEAELVWTIGLPEKVPFGVAAFGDPSRLVVDVLAPPAGAPDDGSGDDGSGDDPSSLEPVGTGDVADSIAAGDGPPVVLTDVRLGAHDGFDRIVFEVAGDGTAGWQVGYTQQPQEQGSGEPLEVPGAATLGITLTNMALPGDAPAGAEPWEGPDRQSIAGSTVLDTVVADTLFEGRYGFFAGLDARRPFAVGLLNSPQRIVVDVLARDAAPPVALAQRCTSPEGFSIAYPAGWAVNVGDTVPACTRFAPDPFTVPPGTDARVGAVSATVEPAAFEDVAGTGTAREIDRRDTTVGDRPAVRVELVHSDEGLYPAGTRATRYVVELPDDADGPRTLVVSTVGLPQFDYARNVRVLDRMIGTVELGEG